MSRKGFTLIETILYLALLGALMGGVIGAAYQLMEAQSKLEDNTATQQETHFVMRKFVWMFDDAVTITKPSASVPVSDTLSVTKGDGTQIQMRLNPSTKVVALRQNGTVFLPLTTTNVSVGSLQFRYLAPQGAGPAGVEASTTIDGVSVQTKKFLRQ